MRLKQELETVVKTMQPLMRPNSIGSKRQLARLTRQPEDGVDRLWKYLEDFLGTSMLGTDDAPLAITDRVKELCRLSGAMLALASGETPCDPFNIEAPTFLARLLLPPVLGKFLALHGSFLSVSVSDLTASVKRNTASGTTQLGFDISDGDDALADADRLGPALPCVVVTPQDHPLCESRSVIPENLDAGECVFVPRSLLAHPDAARFLASIPRVRVVECEFFLDMVAAGHGLGFSPNILPAIPESQKVVVPGVEVQLRLYRPRKNAAMTEPLTCLIELLRRAVVEHKHARQAITIDPPAVNGEVATPETSGISPGQESAADL